MSDSGVARFQRFAKYVQQVEENGDFFTPAEMEHLVEDSKEVFTPQVANCIKHLVRMIQWYQDPKNKPPEFL